MAKRGSRKSLVKTLDMWFSRYIRWSNADADGNCACATCDTIKHVKAMQCGHFMSRRHYSTRWVEKNCAPQCYGCNIGDQGRQYKFSLYIDTIHGEGVADSLSKRAAESRKYTDTELRILAQYYKDKVDEYTNKHS